MISAGDANITFREYFKMLTYEVSGVLGPSVDTERIFYKWSPDEIVYSPYSRGASGGDRDIWDSDSRLQGGSIHGQSVTFSKFSWMDNVKKLFKGEIHKNPERIVLLLDPNKMYADVAARQTDRHVAAIHNVKYMDVPNVLECSAWYCGAVQYVADVALPSPLLASLARGMTASNMETGKETELEERILAMPDRSVTPAILFSAAFDVHGGDVFQALITTENVLTSHRAQANREQTTPVAGKLAYVSDLDDGTGDNIGSYYHFFGTALFAYAKDGTFVAEAAVIADEIPSFFMEPIDAHETVAGINGASFGKMLRSLPTELPMEPMPPTPPQNESWDNLQLLACK